jgi:hypothetical protein
MARYRRPDETMSDVDYRTILAGLRGEDCPSGGNPFLHLHARFRDVDGPKGDLIRTVMAELVDAFQPAEDDE